MTAQRAERPCREQVSPVTVQTWVDGNHGVDRSAVASCGTTTAPVHPPFFTAEELAEASRRNRAEHEAQGLPYPNPDPVRKARVSRLLFPSGWDRVSGTGDEAA